MRFYNNESQEDICNILKKKIGSRIVYKPSPYKNNPKKWEYGILSQCWISKNKEKLLLFVEFSSSKSQRCSLEDIEWDEDE